MAENAPLRIVFFLQCDIFYNLFLFETTCVISAEVVSSNLGRGQEYLIQQIGEKTCNCSCFEIDQEMDAILLIIGIVYGVCRIVIKSVQQCTYFLFFVNLLISTYLFLI
jgi:hypothetical protein